MNNEKICAVCKQTKPLNMFHKRGKDRFSQVSYKSACKICTLNAKEIRDRIAKEAAENKGKAKKVICIDSEGSMENGYFLYLTKGRNYYIEECGYKHHVKVLINDNGASQIYARNRFETAVK